MEIRNGIHGDGNPGIGLTGSHVDALLQAEHVAGTHSPDLCLLEICLDPQVVQFGQLAKLLALLNLDPTFEPQTALLRRRSFRSTKTYNRPNNAGRVDSRTRARA